MYTSSFIKCWGFKLKGRFWHVFPLLLTNCFHCEVEVKVYGASFLYILFSGFLKKEIWKEYSRFDLYIIFYHFASMSLGLKIRYKNYGFISLETSINAVSHLKSNWQSKVRPDLSQHMSIHLPLLPWALEIVANHFNGLWAMHKVKWFLCKTWFPKSKHNIHLLLGEFFYFGP